MPSIWAIEGKITRFSGDIPPDLEPLLREKGAFQRDGAWWATETAWQPIKRLLGAAGVAIGNQPTAPTKTCQIDVKQAGTLVVKGNLPRRLHPAWLGRLQGRDYVGLSPLALELFIADCRKDGIQPSLSPSAAKVQADLQDRARRIAEALDARTTPPPGNLAKGTLWEFQRRTLPFAQATLGRLLIGDEPGLGKTIQGIAIKRLLGAKRVVVVCPSVALWNWASEIADYDGGSTFVIEGERTVHPAAGVNWVMVSYATLDSHAEPLRKWKPDLVICDESHFAKSHDSVRSRAAKSLARVAPHVSLLSGTPIKNRVMDLWNQLDMIAPGWFGYRFDFGVAFANGRKTHWGWKFGASDAEIKKGIKASSNEDILNQYLKMVMIRRETTEVRKDLPPKRRTILPVDLAPAYRMSYDNEWKTFLKFAEDQRKLRKAIQADMVRLADLKPEERPLTEMQVKAKLLGVLNRLRQISSAGRVGATVERCLELHENGKPVVAFAYFLESLDAIADALKLKGLRVAKVNGSMPPAERIRLAKEFQAGNIDAFVAQIEAAGIAINLFRADTTIAHDLVYTPTDLFTQAEGRVNRIGQQNQTHHLYVVGKGTQDEDIIRHLMSKVAEHKGVLDTGKPVSDDIVNELYSKFFAG